MGITLIKEGASGGAVVDLFEAARRIEEHERRLNEIEAAVIAIYRQAFVSDSIPEMEPLLRRLLELKVEPQ